MKLCYALLTNCYSDEMGDKERLQGGKNEEDLFPGHGGHQDRQASDYAQKRDFSTPSGRRADDNVSETCHRMKLRPRGSQTMSSSEKNIQRTHPQYTSVDARERQLLERRCHNHRKEISALRSTLSAERDKHERQIQMKDEELRRRSLEATKLRESVESYTRQKLILQPQQELKDSDIAFKYQDLCTAIADWEELQFGHLDNPLETLEQIEGSQNEIELLQAYLSVHGEAHIAFTHPATGNIMLTYVIHRHLSKMILQDSICWPSLSSYHEDLVAFIKRSMKSGSPPRGMMTVPSSFWKLNQGR